VSVLPDDARPERHRVTPSEDVTEQLPVPGPATSPAESPPPVRPQLEFRPPPSTVLSRRPRVVSVSAVLWVVAGVLVGAAALLMLLDLDGVRRAVQAVVDAGFANVPAVKRQRVVGLTTTVLVVGAAVGIGQILLAWRLRAGRGVRFVLMLLLALAVAEAVLAIGVVDLAIRVALLLGVAVGAMAAVLMYLPAANLWFTVRHR
jgi:hypothetical protein